MVEFLSKLRSRGIKISRVNPIRVAKLLICFYIYYVPLALKWRHHEPPFSLCWACVYRLIYLAHPRDRHATFMRDAAHPWRWGRQSQYRFRCQIFNRTLENQDAWKSPVNRWKNSSNWKFLHPIEDSIPRNDKKYCSVQKQVTSMAHLIQLSKIAINNVFYVRSVDLKYCRMNQYSLTLAGTENVEGNQQWHFTSQFL